MRALVQRVLRASVSVGEERVARIGPGLLVLLGVHAEDQGTEADRMARKLLALRVFEDADGRMNRSVEDVGGEILCVSQFTLYADTLRGHRPSFAKAASPQVAEPLFERVCDGLGAARGRFGKNMAVELVNDGPVTLMVET
ncbi:MAG: D-aminoacyl-tRNA deacylase [Thermoleophilaceae bacterium]